MPDRFDKFTDRARHVLQLAQEEAQRFQHNYIGTEHLLLGLIREQNGVAARVLERLGVGLDDVRGAVQLIIGRGEHTRTADIGLTRRAKKVIEFSVDEARRLNHHYIGTEHLLLGLLREGEGLAASVLESLGVSLASVRSMVIYVLNQAAHSPGLATQAPTLPRGTPVLDELGSNVLTETLPDSPEVGHDQHVDRVIQVLLRRTRHNPILVGGAGVGAMTVVRGLARRAEALDLPLGVPVRRIVALEADRLEVTGSQANFLVGALEAMVIEAKAQRILLCLPDLHRLPAESHAVLGRAVTRGEVRIIGVISPTEYHDQILRHAWLIDSCEPVLVEEPSVEQTLDMLQAAKAGFEQHHALVLSEAALHAAAELASRYLPERLLPRAAFDLLDEAASLWRARQSQASGSLPEALPSVSAQDVADALGPLAGIPAERISLEQRTATPEAVADALRTRFPSPLADALVDAFGQRRSDARPAGLLAFAPRRAARRQFGQTLAETLFGTPAALVELDLMRAPWRLVTYPPGRVWFPEDYRLADRLRHRPASVVVLTNADRASPAGLDLAEHILRIGHLTDDRGRRLDLRQAAIIVIAARGTQIDPTLQSLIRSETNL